MLKRAPLLAASIEAVAKFALADSNIRIDIRSHNK